MRAAIFGDIGGHAGAFFRALETLGVDLTTGEIPKDLTIVQLGDLIHKGPDSEAIVAFVSKVFSKSPDQWVQLLGNHEMQHLGGYEFWRCSCSRELIASLHSWWGNGQASTVAGISHAPVPKVLTGAPTLLSHAGVTSFLWNSVGESDFTNGGKALLARQVDDFAELNRPGAMLGAPVSFRAGLIWAHSTLEVYPSWREEVMPFNQIHGHTAPFAWEHKSWYPGTSKHWRQALKCHPDIRATSFTPSEDAKGNLIALDPGFSGQDPTVREVPFLLVEDYVRLF